MREIPKKNYFILFVVFISVVVITFILINFYNNNNQVTNESIMKDIINIIKYDEIDTYISEYPNVIIYINDSSIDNSELENKLKEIINDNNISQYFIYVEKNKNVIKKYSLDNNSPIFVAYKNGKVSEMYSKEEYKIDEVEGFLVRNEVLEND